MLPKATVPEGSRKVLNGVEVYTRHNFTTERGNFFETMGGDYILPNGKVVEDRTILESLPDPQRQKALAWWEQTFLGVEEETVEVEKLPLAGRKMTKEELRAKAQFLLEQADMMEDEEVDEGSTEVVKVPESAEVASERAGQPKGGRELKTSPAKPKKDRETSVLSQMGVAI